MRLRLIVLVTFALLLGVPVQAQSIKVVVPFAAGGPVDTMARLVSSDMQTRLKTDMVVENRGGAGGVLATEQVARAAPDGKTLLFASSGSHVISAALRSGQLSYDPVKSFAPIGFVGAVPMLVVVAADYPAKTLAELIAKAKAEKLSYASAGAGSTMHIIGEVINSEAGIATTHVPYKGVARRSTTSWAAISSCSAPTCQCWSPWSKAARSARSRCLRGSARRYCRTFRPVPSSAIPAC
jgi:tripartite-type tricarboxylate transporter receptor subunit TctC